MRALETVSACLLGIWRERRRLAELALDRMGARSNYRAAAACGANHVMAPHFNAVNNPLQKRGYLNQELVKDGWCWWYRKHAPRNTELARLEQNARVTKKGLWVDPAHVPPWEWRKRSR
jgi:hypothetical protein